MASNPPMIHSPAMCSRLVPATNSAAESTAASGSGTIARLKRRQAQARSDQVARRPTQAVAGKLSQRVSQPQVQ